MIHDILGINLSAHKIFQKSKFMKNYTGVICHGSKTLTRGGLVNTCGVRDFAQEFWGVRYFAQKF